LSVGAKLIIYKAVIRSVFTYECSAREFAAELRSEIAATTKQNPPHHW